MSTLITFIQHKRSTGNPSHSNQVKNKKRHPKWSGKSKMLTITNHQGNQNYNGILPQCVLNGYYEQEITNIVKDVDKKEPFFHS